MKKKALISSILTIALCLSLIAGSTFALFTHVTDFNIAVTSGNVEILATAKISAVYSAKGTTGEADDKYLVDKDGYNYTHGDPLNKFSNGGTATIESGVLKIARITPGDRVDFNINVENKSTVTIAYRYKITANDPSLATGMVVTVDGKSYEALKSYTSAWFIAEAPDGTPNPIDPKPVSVELPVYAGNEYESKSVEYTVVVEAVQSNAVVKNEAQVTVYPTMNAVKDSVANDGEVVLVGNGDLDMDGMALNGSVFNNGNVTVSDGAINVEAVGFQNNGNATLTDIVMNAGSTVDYGVIGSAGSTTVLNNTDIKSGGGAVGAVNGAQVTFNGGNVEVDSKSTSGRYLFYAAGEGTVIIINEGNFDFNKTQNQKRAYICAMAGSTVYVTGGTFGKASTRSGYTAGILTYADENGVLETGKVIITGGTFGFDPTTWVADGYKAMKVGDQWMVVDEAVDAIVSDSNSLDSAIAGGADTIMLGSGNYIIPDSAQGKNLTIIGNGDSVVATQDDGSYEGCDYSLDGSTVTFENITINTTSKNYTGYARLNATYKNCTINGTYTLYGNSVFENCTFNVSGDKYNLWTWGAPNATFNNCTFNSDGKALLLYGQANTNLVLNDCTFNDNGGLTDKKAAIEIGNDYNKSYTLTVNNTVVNGYEINDKGINTGSTLWGNKNSMGIDKLNVVIDGVDVY